jgi:hypothetical protein
MTYIRSDKNKSAIYLATLPLFTRGLVHLPDHVRLLRELRLLELHTHRSGNDTVDHGRHGSDDHASLRRIAQSGVDLRTGAVAPRIF